MTFGGVSILAVRDLYQLTPVGQALLFHPVSDCYAKLYGSGSLWVNRFQMIELTEAMRQRGDSAFSELLCRVRLNSCTHQDIQTLKSREIASDTLNYPNQALHVYRLNIDVDSHNALMLYSLAQKVHSTQLRLMILCVVKPVIIVSLLYLTKGQKLVSFMVY